MAAEPIVLTCTLVTLGSTVGGDLRSGNGLDPKKIVGGFLSMAACSIIAELDGELGAGLAIAVAGTAFIKFGIPAINLPGTIASATGPATKTSTKTSIIPPRLIFKGAKNSGLSTSQANLLAGRLNNGQRIG